MSDKYDLESNNTLDRREMQCPRCFEYRLEPDHDVINEFSGQRDKVLYATECSNEACPVDRIDPDDIRKQTPNQNVIQRFAADYGIVATIVVLALIAVVAAVGLSLSGLIGPGSPVDFGVTVHEPNSVAGLEGVEVTLDGTTQTTGPDGTVSFGLIGPEVTKQVDIRPDPEGPYAAPPPSEITVGDGQVWGENPHPDIDAGIQDGQLTVVLHEPYAFEEQAAAPDGQIELPFANAHNAQRGVDVTLHGVEQPSATQVAELEEQTETVTAIDNPQAQAVTVRAPVSERNASESGTYSGTVSLGFDGQRQTDGVLRLDDPSGQYSSVTLGRDRVCTRAEVAANDGVCHVPDEYLDGEAVALSLDEAATGMDYTFEYTAQSVAESVTVMVNGEAHEVTRPSGDAGEPWEQRITIDSLVEGENTVEYETPSVESVMTTADVAVEYELDTGIPESPTVYVESADGETYEHGLSEETLEQGVLIGSQTVSLDPAWFGEGMNRVWVETENDGRVLFEVSAELGMPPNEIE